MSSISIIAFGNINVMCTKLSENFYNFVVPISFFSSKSFLNCLMEFSTKLYLNENKLKKTIEDIKFGIKNQILYPKVIHLECNKYYKEKDMDYIAIDNTSISTSDEKQLFAYQQLSSLENQLYIPIIIRLLPTKEKPNHIMMLDDIISDNQLIQNTEISLIDKIYSKLLLSNFMLNYSNNFFNSILKDLLKYYLSLINSVNENNIVNIFDVFLENESFLKLLKKYNNPKNYEYNYCINVSNNIFSFILKYSTISDDLLELKKNLIFINEEDFAPLFENNLLSKHDINKLISKITNNYKIIINNIVQNYSNLYNFQTHKLPFFKYLISKNYKLKYNTVPTGANSINAYTNLFTYSMELENKLSKDLCNFDKNEFLEVIIKYLNDGGMYSIPFRNSIKNYIIYCVNNNLGSKSSLLELTNIVHNDYINAEISSNNQSEYYYSTTDMIDSIKYMYYHCPDDDIALKQNVLFQIFSALNYTKENISTVTNYNYMEILKNDFTFDLFGELYFMEDLFYNFNELINDYILLKSREKRIKDLKTLFNIKVFNPTNTKKIEALIEEINSHNILKYNIGGSIKTKTKLRKSLSYLVIKNYMKVHNITDIDGQPNSSENNRQIVDLLFQFLNYDIKYKSIGGISSRALKEFRTWYNNSENLIV